MRGLALLVLGVGAACGGHAPAGRAAPHARMVAARTPAVGDQVPVDPIAALAPVDDAAISWLVPGKAQLEIGGPPIDATAGGKPIDVTIIEQHGNLVRVAVRLEAARFSLWTDRTRLMALVRRDQRVSQDPGRDLPGEMQVVLRAGARVKRLAHKDEWSQVRYFGAVEVDGWIPDASLGDAGPSHDPIGRVPSGHRTLMVVPGAVIRAEPRWAARELAVMANGYFVDEIKTLDDGWVEVAYADGDVVVSGYVSRRDPPGRVHRPHADADAAPIPVVPNGKVASGTCLYAKGGGDPIGYVVGDRDVELDDAGAGWWTLALDTPWGALAFAAQGPTRSELVACAPTGSVPPPAGAVLTAP